MNGDEPEGKQNYFRVHRAPEPHAGSHELLAGLEGTDLVPAAGRYCVVEAEPGAEVPLRLAHPFIIFPEGLSYTAEPDLDHPMMIAAKGPGGSGGATVSRASAGSRTVYFPGQIDRLHGKGGLPDLSTLMANAVRWCAAGSLPLLCEAPNTVYAALRLQEGRAMIHLVNLSGGRRYLRQIIPLRNIAVRIKKDLPVLPSSARAVGAYLLPQTGSSTGSKRLAVRDEDNRFTVVVPELRDYEVLVIEGA